MLPCMRMASAIARASRGQRTPWSKHDFARLARFHSSPWPKAPPPHQRQTMGDIIRERMEQQQREQGHQYTASTQASHLGRGVGQVAPQVKWLQQAYKVAQKGGAQAHPRAGQRQPRWGLIGLVVGGGCVYYVVNLEQVPATGRWRFLDVSIAEELQMGKDAYEGTMQQFGGQLLSSLSPSSMQVHRVAKRIIAACEELDVERAANAKPTEWTIHVVDDPEQKNAFVLPGGHIFVFTGILPVCENDAGLATVMSHEIAHQIARHSAEKMAGTKILMAGAFVLDMMGLDIGLSRILLNLILSYVHGLTQSAQLAQAGERS